MLHSFLYLSVSTVSEMFWLHTLSCNMHYFWVVVVKYEHYCTCSSQQPSIIFPENISSYMKTYM